MPATRRDATKDLMAAVYPLLNVAAFTAVATGGVHHGQAPQKTSMPYAVLEAPAWTPAIESMSNPGQEIDFDLRAVSNAPDYAASTAIAQKAAELLEGQRPTIANHHVLRLWVKWSRTFADPELVNGVPVWNTVTRFCALVDQTG